MRNGYCLLLLAFLAGCGGGGGGRKAPDADADGVADAQDCAVNDASRWQNLSYQSIDSDADGRRVSSSGQLCTGSSLPSTHFASAATGDLDCNDSNGSLWRILPYVSRDADGDGFGAAASGEVCSGDDLPSGYSTAAPQIAVADCDDSSATVWRVTMTYGDADGDGVGAGGGTVMCIGAQAPPARSLLGYDPVDDPSDPTATAVSNVELPVWLLTSP